MKTDQSTLDVHRGENSLSMVGRYGLTQAIWKYRFIVIGFFALSLAATAIYCALTARQYRATTVLLSASTTNASSSMLSSAMNQLGGLGSLVSGSKDPEAEEALAVLRSRAFIERFISKNSLLPVLYASAWDDGKKEWRSNSATPPTLGRGARTFLKKILSVIQDKKTGLIQLSITWKDPQLASVWANDLVADINAEMRTRALTRANDSLRFLQIEVERTSEVSAREAINRLIEAAIKQRMLVNVTEEYSLKIVDRAFVPEPSEYVSPNFPYAMATGGTIGLLLGICVAVVRFTGPVRT